MWMFFEIVYTCGCICMFFAYVCVCVCVHVCVCVCVCAHVNMYIIYIFLFILQSKDSKRSPVASVGETQEEVKCKRLKESRVCIVISWW